MVLRTTNKKCVSLVVPPLLIVACVIASRRYFKRIDIPFLRREGMPIEPSLLGFDYGHNTVVITYTKPPPVLAVERAKREERRKKAASSKEGDVDCKQQ